MRLKNLITILPAALLFLAETIVLPAQTPAQGELAVPIELSASVISATPQLTTTVGDTLLFNPTALNVEEDATLKEILKKIPGIEVSGGSVTLHGKPISALYVNGQRFFGGDVRSGMDNLTADMIDKIAAYERESEFTRITGIEDGEVESVLDVRIRKSIMDGWVGRINAGYGLQNRYAVKADMDKIRKDSQDVILANFNNEEGKPSINDASQNKMGHGSAGDGHDRNVGYSLSRQNKNLEMDASVLYTGSTDDLQRQQRTQYIYPNSQSFTLRNGGGKTDIHTPKLDFRLAWRPDKKNTLTVKGNAKYTWKRADNEFRSASLSSDPFEIVPNPNDYVSYGLPSDILKPIRSYLTHSLESSRSNNFNEAMYVYYAHRFKKKGRVLSMNLNETFSCGLSDLATDKETRYKKKEEDPVNRNQNISTANNLLTISAQLAYSEPIGKYFHVNLVAKGIFKRAWQQRDFYDGGAFADDLSSYGTMNSYGMTATANLKYVRKKVNVTAGVSFFPQWTVLKFKENQSYSSPVDKFMFNVAPNLILSYSPTKRRHLSVRYNGWTGMPGLTNVLPVPSGTDPSYIRYGNPDLLQEFIQEGTLSYDASSVGKGWGLVANLTYRNRKNAVCISTDYDPETGYRTVTPRNIDGNWWIKGNFSFNKTFRNDAFSTANTLSAQYDNKASLLYNRTLKYDEVSITRRTMLRASSDWTYRNSWFESVAEIYADGTLERSLLRSDLNQSPFTISGCLSLTFTMPWNMRLSTDFSYIAQRGFIYDDLNRDYMLWNASLSQSFLKKKLTLRLEAFDILSQMVNMTSSLASESRTSTFFNGVNSYAIIRLIYRFNRAK